MHRHLRRLERISLNPAFFFVTTCTRNRKAILVSEQVATILIQEWRRACDRYGWHVGRYVIMPDHVHLFWPRNRMLDRCQSLLALGNAGAVDEFPNCRGQRPRLQLSAVSKINQFAKGRGQRPRLQRKCEANVLNAARRCARARELGRSRLRSVLSTPPCARA